MRYRRLRKYKNAIIRKRFLSFTIFLVGLLLSVVAINILANTGESISTKEADALYGGFTDDTSYPFAGYLINYSSIFTSQVCGVTFISDDTVVTAAHCIGPTGLYFAGSGDLRTPPDQNRPVSKYLLHDKWDSQTLEGDLAILVLDGEPNLPPPYAVIGTPEVGCNYEILAYGSTDELVLSNKDLRRRASICIDRVMEDRVFLYGEDGGICFGDSGSPIFEKGSTRLVAVMSAITTDNKEYSKENCFINNRAVAMRVDTSMNFLISSQSSLKADDMCPIGSSVLCVDGETCRSNSCRKASSYVYVSAFDERSDVYILTSDYLSYITYLIGALTIYMAFRVVREIKQGM